MNEITKKEVATPSQLLQIAISKDADLDKLEKLMDLQMRWEQNEAKKAYYSALAEWKKNPPEIVKTIQVSFSTGKGKTEFKHADLADIAQKVNESMAPLGLIVTWKIHQNPDTVGVTCMITHRLGYSEETTMYAPPDTSGNKNNIQAIGSTISYLERYTLLAITGLAAKGVDNEEVFAKDTISDAQIKQINKAIEELCIDKEKFLNYLGVGSVEEITDYNKAIAAINAKKKTMATPEQKNEIRELAKGFPEKDVERQLKCMTKEDADILIAHLKKEVTEGGR